jgi:hypothetical protein
VQDASIDEFFTDHSKQQITVPSFDSLPNFHPSDNNIHAAKVRDMGIKTDPTNASIPLLHLHGLPDLPDLPDPGPFKEEGKFQPPPLSSEADLRALLRRTGGVVNVLGVLSGAGKTRMMNEFAALVPTLVINAVDTNNTNGHHNSDSPGSDVAYAPTNTREITHWIGSVVAPATGGTPRRTPASGCVMCFAARLSTAC